ncbi:centromere protein C isoform X2 [Caloenas nicobarica]|uniref:centromere protein C isoform X2 n=1 Tax=Caloenas nicobarica TaxID=187106 RepID=UPI0032B8364A
MSSSSSRRHRLVEDLNYLKTDYRPRFCCGRGNEINVQPSQDVMKFIEDCFKNTDSDLTIGSPSPNLCLPSVVQDEKTTSTPSTSPNAGLSNFVKRARNSAESLSTVNSRDPEDDRAPVGSPILLEEVESSPVHMLHLDDQSTAAVKGYLEGENLEDLQTARDEQVDLLQGTECTAMSSVQKEKSFALMALAALAPGTLGERYSASISQPSPPPVKDQDIEVESECEFLIVSDDASFTSSFSIPWKSTKSKKDGSATPVMKSQPSEKKTESKNSKNKNVQVEALSKQKMPALDVGVHDSKGAPQSDPVSSNSEKKVFKSRRQSSAHMGKAKKNSLRQGSLNQKKDAFWEPEAKELVLSESGLETEASGSDQCKPRVVPSEDLPVPSAGHQQERTVSLKTCLKSSKCLQLASKASQHLAQKKQNAHQKLSKDKVAERLAESLREKHKKPGKKSSNKKPQLQSGESLVSEAGEQGLEIQPEQLTEVFTLPLPHKLQASVVQKLDKSGKPENACDTWESLGNAGNTTPVKALDIDSVQNSEKKLSSAKSGKMPKKIPHRNSKDVCSDPEDASDTQSTVDSDSSSVQLVARKKQKPSSIKIKSNKRKRNIQRGLHGPVLEPSDKFTSRSESSEQDNTFSENSEDSDCQVKNLLSDTIRHKIVMPSNTPNVRRTKRIRMRPLEYWRGERVNYMMRPSGELVISGIVCPETEPPRKIKWRKCGLKQKRDEARSEVPANLDHTLADTSKPTVVLDPVTNKEVLLECVNTESSHSCFFEDESVEVYKNLNTSAFATGTLILKPFKEKGHQYVHMDTIAFHVIHGRIIVTLHKSSYYLTAGDDFYVPAGNEYNIRNLLNEESVLFFTQLKKDRHPAEFVICR